MPATLSTPLRQQTYTARMFHLARLARHPLLAPYFEVVHPIFWPILLWQLMKASEQIDAAGSREALIYISWWGGVRIDYLGDNIQIWKKPEASKPDWNNPVWETHLPSNLVTLVLNDLQADQSPRVPSQEAHPERSRRISGLTPNTS